MEQAFCILRMKAEVLAVSRQPKAALHVASLCSPMMLHDPVFQFTTEGQGPEGACLQFEKELWETSYFLPPNLPQELLRPPHVPEALRGDFARLEVKLVLEDCIAMADPQDLFRCQGPRCFCVPLQRPLWGHGPGSQNGFVTVAFVSRWALGLVRSLRVPRKC